MKLYRLLGNEELNLILEGEILALGEYFGKTLCNTHKYKSGEKYMHFFFNKENCEHIKKLQGDIKKGNSRFIAEFDIPLKRIIGHIGRGFYVPKQGGYDYDHDTCYELALPVKIFNPQWLSSYEKVDENTKMAENQPE